MSRPLRTRLAAAAASAPLVLVLAACGDDPAPTSTSSSPGDDTSAASADTAGTALVAARTGLAEVPNGTVFSVDREDRGGWEVTVVTDAGAEYDVRVADDGRTVRGEPVRDRDDGDDAIRDRDERKRLLGVGTDYRAAVAAADARAEGGSVTGVSLDDENGRAEWEVTYDEDTPDELSVHLDAGSGKVLRTERDD